jgi:hypothetical protein
VALFALERREQSRKDRLRRVADRSEPTGVLMESTASGLGLDCESGQVEGIELAAGQP